MELSERRLEEGPGWAREEEEDDDAVWFRLRLRSDWRTVGEGREGFAAVRREWNGLTMSLSGTNGGGELDLFLMTAVLTIIWSLPVFLLCDDPMTGSLACDITDPQA